MVQRRRHSIGYVYAKPVIPADPLNEISDDDSEDDEQYQNYEHRSQSLSNTIHVMQRQAQHQHERITDTDRNQNTNQNSKDEDLSSFTGVLTCSCNAGEIEKELLQLREATSQALTQSWDEIESLREKVKSRVEEIETLGACLHEIEDEQRYAMSRIQTLTDEIEWEKKPKRRPSLAAAGRTLSRSFSLGKLSNLSSHGESLITKSCHSRLNNLEQTQHTTRRRSLSNSCNDRFSLDRSNHSHKSNHSKGSSSSAFRIGRLFKHASSNRLVQSSSENSVLRRSMDMRKSCSDSCGMRDCSPCRKGAEEELECQQLDGPLPEVVLTSDSSDDGAAIKKNAKTQNTTDSENVTSQVNGALEEDMEMIEKLKLRIQQREETMESLQSSILGNSDIVQNLQQQLISWDEYDI